ncbi:ParB-like nuclease domain protein [Streptomyces phage Daubenski]|uniref:ParB-like nuclease domain protein n=1 Tax=Streptomyces phage Daubenski TaxID=2653725 RepID=A0A5Q2WI20_9CAUD|nr:ParB-like nuclease domain protein [Streptomyces phage Daubenski]YP_010104980.1 ParB-like nuclease domain protein [Streptomyces phage Daubenski]QGH76323.1 ParB-like nuclease domain protein [Streptomyces phage Daubenski]QGH76521.1 ParB-like nuclease domain protein [Streptomyces phage Daubenski]
MAKVSVAKLIESAIFNDAEAKGHTTWQMLEEKFDDLFIGNPTFLESIQADGIQTPIMYQPDENKVYEGHHRILCAWLLNIEDIEYTTEWYVQFDEAEICLFE